MVWHIFKKDWKLLWRLVVGVAAVHWTTTVIAFNFGHFGENRTLAPLLNLFQVIAFLGSGCLIAAVVHQDAIPGVRQDWLVRPVQRRDLLLAKFLFVLVMVQGPILAADLVEGLANGFPLSQSLGAAVSRGVYLLLGFSLPVLAFASLTRSLAETVVGGVAAFFGFALFQMVSVSLARGVRLPFEPTGGTGIGWVAESGRFALALLVTIAVLGLQYFRRKTTPARGVTAGVALLCMFTQFVPWQPAFAIQQRLSQSAGASSPILMAFEPNLGKLRRPPGLNFEEAARWSRTRWDEGDATLYLPLGVAGLPSDVVLKADRSEMRLVGADGKTENLGLGDDLEIRKEGPSDGETRIHHAIHVRGDLYSRIKDQPVRLEIVYSLTLLRLASSHAIPALGGDQRMPGVGWCETKVNQAGTAVRLRCLQAGKGTSCGTVFLEHGASGRRNPAMSACSADYAPYFGQYIPDAMSRFGVNLPFRDPTGLARYPVDGSQLPESHVVLRVYRVEDHFTRRLVIPGIRLKDWEPE